MNCFKQWFLCENSGDPQRWLSKETSWTLDKLRSIAPLPFKQGILLELVKHRIPNEEAKEIEIVCILQDAERTTNLLYHLNGKKYCWVICLLGQAGRWEPEIDSIIFIEIRLPSQCSLDSIVPRHYTRALRESMQSLASADYHDEIRFLACFTRASFTQGDREINLKSGCLIVTGSTILLTGEKLQWLLPMDGIKPDIIAEHTISNLIEVVNIFTFFFPFLCLCEKLPLQ